MWIEEIESRSAKRRERWSYIECRELPALHRVRETAIVGSYSICGMETKSRWIKRPVCIELAAGAETPTAIARDYLLSKYKKSPKCTHAQIVSISQELRVNPAFAVPGTFERGFYIDIRAAYYSILNRVGWDLDYWPGRWLRFGEPCFDFPFPNDKRARICLVSSCISAGVPYHYVGRLQPDERANTSNGLLNLQLWRLVQDVLFAVALEVRDVGAIYGLIDGYIAPDFEIAQKVIAVIKSWGLDYSVKRQGRGYVMGHGAYKFGRMADKEFSPRIARPMSNIVEREYNHWLKSAFTRF